jgi:hypothetical protein
MPLIETALHARQSVSECLSSAESLFQQVLAARDEAERRCQVRTTWLRVLVRDVCALVDERLGDFADWNCEENTLDAAELRKLLDEDAGPEALAEKAHALIQAQRSRKRERLAEQDEVAGSVGGIGNYKAELEMILCQLEKRLKEPKSERAYLARSIASIATELDRCAALLKHARQLACSALQDTHQ